MPLNPQEAVFEGMLAGWATQQRSRFLWEEATIGPRAALVRRMVGFTGQYPWEWEPAEAEAFISHLRSGAQPVAVSTARGYETALRLVAGFRRQLGDPPLRRAGLRQGRRTDRRLTDLERLGQNNADMQQTVIDRICAYLLLSSHRYAEPGL